MKPSINDVANFEDLKRTLSEKDVSAATINTLEKALKKGMSFRGAADLSLLNIATVDLGVVKDNVDFSSPAPSGTNLKTVEYRFKPIGDEDEFYGYQLIVRSVKRNGFTVEEAFPIEDDQIVIVDYDLAELKPDSVVTLHANTATGERTKIKVHGAGAADEFLEVPVANLGNAAIDVTIVARDPLENPEANVSYSIKGRVISNQADAKLDGYQVVLFAAIGSVGANAPPDFVAVAAARTETNGYFVTGPLLFQDPLDLTRVTAAKASISKGNFSTEQAIHLVVTEPVDEETPRRSILPERVILVINESTSTEGTTAHEDCGCSELNFHEKKVLEEYSYYTVVRTTEPSIIADVLEDERDVDLEDVYGVPGVIPFSVFKKFNAIENKQIKPSNFLTAAIGAAAASGDMLMRTNAVAPAANPTGVAGKPFNRELLDKLLVDHKVSVVIRGNAKPVFKGRTHLNQTHQIDWDDTPTIYQAASIAHGHLLHFKQEWLPDGYSIGDLVYSLPLAPGQKKQIAVVDWERRESAANSQALDYEETLNNSLVRDRDVNEIISGTLTENIRGNSKATTSGIGFGTGGAILGVFTGGAYGALLGISGGKSSSGSSSSQSSNRESTANSLQQISDRTMQAASVVRSQRATVVQTVSQGERVQATAESVANYNHCHAVTIQYFEVLRHFAVRNRLAGVQECLFVPLQMSPFDLDKCLRWRTSLERHLLRRELLAGFEAIARILQEKESAFENYYDSIGFPRKNFAEQAVVALSGELFLEFYFFNTNERKVDDAIVAFYSFFGISLDGYRDKQITDEELSRHVGPRAIEFLLDAFTIETDKGIDLRLDLTLLSSFRQNASLRVSVRQSAGTPVTVPRDQIGALTVRLDLSKIQDPAARASLADFQNKYLKIRLRSGNLRYRTDNFAGSLFEGRIENDIFANGDGAFITTPLTRDELRNPRGEDVNAANNLLHHLNENLEHYNKCLLLDMTPERRFMLLDGILAPGKANGRSVASVVENRVIGIAGNSLIMPVAPGYQLDPTIDEKFDLFAQYYGDEPEPMRISVPTKGVYAESVMGKCNACEEKEEGRFWRWEESPIPDSPSTPILPLNTDTRRADPGNLQPKDFPNPVVNIQNAPSVPDPAGLQGLLTLLGKGDAFRDATGLSQNQLNALATFQKTLDTAQGFGKDAAELAKTAAMLEAIKDAKQNGTISNEDANEKAGKVLDEAVKPKKTADSAQFEEGVRLIDSLEKEGVLGAEDAQEVKQKLKRAFLNGKSALSPDELSTVRELAAQGGDTSVSKEEADGSKFSLSSLFGGSDKSTRVALTDVSAFRPGLDSDYDALIQPVIALLQYIRVNLQMQTPWKLDKDTVFDRLEALITDPNKINQDDLNLCGPAAFFRLWIERDPSGFATYAITLFFAGAAKIGSNLVTPDSDVVGKNYSSIAFDPNNPCPQADWMVMVSLRDDENGWYFDFEGEPDEELSAATKPSELASWLKSTGLYKSVSENTSVYFPDSLSQALSLNKYLTTDAHLHDIILFVDSRIIGTTSPNIRKKKKITDLPNHFVVLTSTVRYDGTKVRFSCWSWAEQVSCEVDKDAFESSYYGYILASAK